MLQNPRSFIYFISKTQGRKRNKMFTYPPGLQK